MALLGALSNIAHADTTLPSAEDAVVDLLLGQCLAEKTNLDLPPNSIDPQKVGVSIAANSTGKRLGPNALQIPTRNGTIYFDPQDVYCNVHASEIDAAFITSQIESALKLIKPEPKKADDRRTKNQKGVLHRNLTYMLNTPTEISTIPVVIIYYPLEDSNSLTAGIVIGQKNPKERKKAAAKTSQICGETYTTVRDAYKNLMQKTNVEPLPSDELYESYRDAQTKDIWSFTREKHEAYPAAICRKLVTENERLVIEMQILCQADKKPCDQLTKDFNKLHQTIRENISAAK